MKTKSGKKWTRYPRYKKELACEPGIGHGGVHGCDGCCYDPSFKTAWKRIFKEASSEMTNKLRDEAERIASSVISICLGGYGVTKDQLKDCEMKIIEALLAFKGEADGRYKK